MALYTYLGRPHSSFVSKHCTSEATDQRPSVIFFLKKAILIDNCISNVKQCLIQSSAKGENVSALTESYSCKCIYKISKYNGIDDCISNFNENCSFSLEFYCASCNWMKAKDIFWKLFLVFLLDNPENNSKWIY